MKRTRILLILTLLSGMIACVQAQDVRIFPKDVRFIKGSWNGTLTYLDYSSGKPFTMPAEIDITQVEKSGIFLLDIRYPDEPKANGQDTLKISDDGQYINSGKIISIKRLPDKGLEMITEEAGLDGNDDKPATFRMVYFISKSAFSKKKEVQFVGENEWITRYDFTFQKK